MDKNEDQFSTNAYILVYERDYKSGVRLIQKKEENVQNIEAVLGYNPFSQSIENDIIDIIDDDFYDMDIEELDKNI